MTNSSFINNQLFNQIEQESPESLFWIFSIINRKLNSDPEVKLKEFFRDLKNACPNSFNNYKSILKAKNLKIAK